MSFGAIVFMGLTWALVIGTTIYCFVRILSNHGK